MKRIIIGFLLTVTPLLAQARMMHSWSYQQLYDRADLVAVARPVSTSDTTEKATLSDVTPEAPVVGLSTEFEIRLVMKGEKNLGKLVLHHYRLQDPPKQWPQDGPDLVSFDPTQHRCYLLFLRREADGRYAPVAGQTDPAMFGIIKLEGFAQ
jgi:hypothetical protein